jgi:hypothetical protein
MNRRSYLITALAAIAGLKDANAQAKNAAPAKSAAKGPILLYCDMMVDPKREAEMLKAFHEVFKPAGAKFQGFIDVKVVKFRTAYQGGAPAKGINYRFQLTYESEELRQKWIASDVHQKVWPLIENTLLNKKDYTVWLYDSM